MSVELQSGDWYQASDGQWYCWPSPIPYAGPPIAAPPSRPRGWIPSAYDRAPQRESWLAKHKSLSWMSHLSFGHRHRHV